MSDKEIALELTKSYLEHLNVRVSNKAIHSQIGAEDTNKMFQHFYNVVSKLDDSGK
ncbi:TPA: hypothetical protein ACU2AF_001417 [Staphylococcus aureus]|uniref:hypothetical protein n=1 Tax=Staphylococcus aureus TaxID=1280 RepID=UPI0004528DF4|nr:hypothetical protein [Staphylococcus aureus]KAE59593.1 hypothetical protein W619_00554 [Staphylococcus aureus VET0383R]